MLSRMGRYRNPVLPGCHPDPSICRVGDEFFLVTSTFEYLPGLPVHRSTNLVDWELVGHVVHDELDYDGIPSSGGLFAPTIRHHRGRFFVVCTLMEGRGRSGHFVMTATDPAGPWTPPVWLDGVPGIDPSLTFDGDRVWLCGTRLAEPGRWRGQTDVWLRELDAATLRPIGEERLIWHGAMEGAVWAEGPHILPRPGGGWMLLAAEGGTARDHAVCVAYADELTGPYVGDPGNPRLTHRDLGEQVDIVNVGHADLVDAPDGSSWAVLLATYTHGGLDSLLGRQTHLVPVGWEDRRPLFAPGLGRVPAEMADAGVPDQQPPSARWQAEVDAPLDLGWEAVRRLPADVVEPGRGLALRASAVEPGELGALSFVGRRLPARRVAVTASVSPVAGGRAGILLRTSDDAFLEVAVDDSATVRVRRRADGADEVLVSARVEGVDVEPPALTLRIEGFAVEVSAGDRALAVVDVSGLSTSRAGGFLGSWIGPFAVGAEPAHVHAFGWELLTEKTVDAEPDLV